MTKTINWQVEVDALRDMTVTTCESHRIIAEALWEAMAQAGHRDDGVIDQKILAAKMAAESVSAAEDFGALAWSISVRAAEGILRPYLNYRPREVNRFYERAQAGVPIRELLNIPDDAELTPFLDEPRREILTKSLVELDKVLRTAAGNYLALDGALVRTYNSIKHGFVVIVRLDRLVPGKQPTTQWRQHVNVLTGITPNGSIRYTDLERSLGMLESLMGVIKMCSLASKELASLIIWLSEQHVALDTIRPRGD